VRRAVGLLPGVLAAVVAAAGAQSPPDSASSGAPRVAVSVSRDAAGALRSPVVRAGGALAGGVFAGALHDGFPVRYDFRLELRRSVRILPDRLESQVEWEAIVLLDPLTNEYDLVRSTGAEEHFSSQAALERALAVPFSVDLMPSGGAQYYYVASLTIESLSLSELDEAERWLRGDLGPALSTKGDVGNALGRGVRRLLVRLSGLPRLGLESRSAYFQP
jgi:hypothetical protein